MAMIPVMKPRFPDLTAVAKRFDTINQSGIFSNFGAQTTELSERFASFLGTQPKKVVPVSNATAGIQAAVSTLGGMTWAVPSWTFTATAAGTHGAGVEMFFADIDPATQWINTSAVPESEGVVAVAPFGSGFTESHFDPSRRLVIDAAASIAARIPPLNKLPESNIVVFSFHATKVLGIGEGGLVVCGSVEVADEIRSRVNFGFTGGRESHRIGLNGKMSEFSAAIGHVVLDYWDDEKEHWLEARHKVNSLAVDIGLRSLFSDSDSITPYWVIECESPEQRESVEQACAEAEIQTRQWWARGCHAMPAYQRIRRQALPFTESIAARYLGLPFYRGIADADLSAVRSAVIRGIQNA